MERMMFTSPIFHLDQKIGVARYLVLMLGDGLFDSDRPFLKVPCVGAQEY